MLIFHDVRVVGSQPHPIRFATLFDGDGTQTQLTASQFPVQTGSGPELFRAIIKLFQEGSGKLSVGGAVRPMPLDFLLQVAVPREYSMRGWESVKPGGARACLAEEFLAVAVDPLDDADVSVEMREPLDASSVGVVWDVDPRVVRQRHRACTVLLVGPPAWGPGPDGLPLILSSFSQRAGAILLPHEDEQILLAALGIHDWDGVLISWADLVQRVGKLKLLALDTIGAYRIFLMDSRYQPLPGYHT